MITTMLCSSTRWACTSPSRQLPCYCRVANGVSALGPRCRACARSLTPVLWSVTALLVLAQWLLVDLCVARVRDLGENDTIFYTRCHLGNILQVGDNVWGYDLTCANFNDENANLLDPAELPDVVRRASFAAFLELWGICGLVQSRRPVSAC